MRFLRFPVFNFLFGELRSRKAHAVLQWLIPALLAVATATLTVRAVSADRALVWFAGASLAVAVAGGMVLGWLIAQQRTVVRDDDGRPIVRGSWRTIVIWVCAVALRWPAGLAAESTGDPAAVGLALDGAFVLFVGVGTAVAQVLHHREGG